MYLYFLHLYVQRDMKAYFILTSIPNKYTIFFHKEYIMKQGLSMYLSSMSSLKETLREIIQKGREEALSPACPGYIHFLTQGTGTLGTLSHYAGACYHVSWKQELSCTQHSPYCAPGMPMKCPLTLSISYFGGNLSFIIQMSIRELLFWNLSIFSPKT